jgi:predicted RND superfamily exporter protein
MSGGTAHGPLEQGLLTRLLCFVTRCVVRYPKFTLLCVLLSVVACAGAAALGLKFKTSRADLIDPQADFQQRWLKFTEKFGDQSDLVLVVESDDSARVRLVLDDLGERLLKEPELFTKVSWKFDPQALSRKGLQYLTPAQLEAGLAQLESYGPVLAGHWNRAGLESYCRRLAVHARWAHDNNRPAEEEQAIQQAARLAESLTGFAASLSPQVAGAGGAGQMQFQSPWPEVFPDAGTSLQSLLEVRYQVTTDGKMGFLTSTPTAGEQDFSGTSPTLARLRAIMAEARAKYEGVTFGLTGIPVLESDEMQRSQADMTKATYISFGAVALILLFGFRGLKHPLLGLTMLLVGLAWSIGYTALSIGHLNILSVSFAAILIGLGIDFAIHYLSRYLEMRHEGASLEEALVGTSATVGTGIATGSITTALAFFCAAFTKFLGVAELGIIAGGGILLCASAAFLVLAPTVRLADGKVEPRRLPTPFQGTFLRWTTARFPRAVTCASLAAIVAVTLQAVEWRDGAPQFKVEYDANLLNLQADDVESVRVQQRVFEETNGSLLFAISLAGSPEEAKQKAEQFRQLSSVAHVEHLARVIPDYPPAETELLVQAIHARLTTIAPFPREFPAIDPLAVGQALEELLTVLKASAAPAAQIAASRLNAYLDMFEQTTLEQQVQMLGGYQLAMLTALRVQFERLAEVSDPTPVVAADIAPGVRERFVSPQGDWMLRVFPREQVWDEAPLEHFVNQVRTVDSEATGTPLQNYEAARQIRQSYLQAAAYALIAVVMTLLIDFVASGPLCVALLTPLIVVAFGAVTLAGPDQSFDIRWMACLYGVLALLVATIFDPVSIRNLLLALSPPVVGLAMMFGIMGWQGQPLNPANIIVLPLLLGVGVDYGVFVVHDFRSQSGGYRMSASTINSLVLTSLTSTAGFGSLLVASHKGLASLGMVLALGLATCLFVALVALPAILTVIAGKAVAATEPADLQGMLPDAAPLESEGAPVLLPLPSAAAESAYVGRNLRAAS